MLRPESGKQTESDEQLQGGVQRAIDEQRASDEQLEAVQRSWLARGIGSFRRGIGSFKSSVCSLLAVGSSSGNMGEEASASAPELFYVCERAFNSIAAKLKEGKDITEQDFTDLTWPYGLADDEIMIPVDMCGVFEDHGDLKKSAETYIKAKENFDANKGNEPEGERPKRTSAKKWREICDAWGNDEDKDDGEPASKKAKTD